MREREHLKSIRITNSEQFFKTKTIFHTQSNNIITTKNILNKNPRPKIASKKHKIKINTIKLI